MTKKLVLVCVAISLTCTSPCLASINDNTTLGTGAGENITSGTNNVMLGQGGNITSGSSNILIGNNLTGTTATSSNQLDIGDVFTVTGTGTPSTSAATVKGTLTVNGNLTASGTGNSLGTITSGTWNGTAIGAAYLPSGTVITTTGSPAQGDVLYYNGSNWTDLGAGTNGQVLTTQGASANPHWTTPATSPNYSLASGFVNKFRNGAMQVSQRFASNTAQTLSTAADAYWIDGWEYHITGANVTGYWQNAAFLGGNGIYYPGYMEIKGAASNTAIDIYQKIESYDAAALAGQVVTVQFQFYNDSGATITPTVQSCYASAVDNFTTCTADLSAANMQSCTNGSTCTEAYSFTPSTNATNGYEIQFNFGAMTSSSDIIEMSGFDIRATPGVTSGATNSSPPTPEIPSIQAETARNERYFWGISAAAITPLSTPGLAYSTTTASFQFQYPVTMRATPTATTSQTAADFSIIWGSDSTTACNGLPSFGLMNNRIAGATATIATASFTGGSVTRLISSSTNPVFINFSAEE